MTYPKISLVTIALNGRDYIEDCIRSVVDQNYPNLEYIIIDGSSNDGTLEVIEKYADKVSLLISEPDNGPADALNKGFLRASGDIMGCLNADDRLQPNSLFAVAEIFEALKEVEWIMGYPTWFNAAGTSVNETFHPVKNFYGNPQFINDSLHLKFARWGKWRFAMDDFSAIQQESVFWRRGLWDRAGGYINTDLIAYDMELWLRFFTLTRLYTANVLLSGFRVHGNQLSEIHRRRYKEEAEQCLKEFKIKQFSENSGYRFRTKLAKLMKVFYYYEIPLLKDAYPYLLDLPKFIVYDFKQQKFTLA